MLQIDRNFKNDRGQMAVVAVIVTAMILLTVTLGISTMVVNNYRASTGSIDSVHAYFLAETGIEDAILRLKDDGSYLGGAYSTPIGEYSISVTKNGNDFDIRSEGYVKEIVRVVEASMNIESFSPEITKYGVFGGDDVWMIWGTSEVRGDIWANDDIDFTSDSTLYGNVFSAGEGGFFTSWVNWGSEIKDNPGTADKVEGNVFSVNSIKVWGGHIYGDAHSEGGIYTLFDGLIDGTRYPNESLGLEEISVPVFDYDTYKSQAQAAGTFFHTANEFETYVNGQDDGYTRTLPDGVYYIETGNIMFGTGNPIILNGSIITQGNIYFYCGLEINAQNNLPAIASHKDIEIRDYGSPFYGGDFVTINGLLYSERDIILRHDDSGKDIVIDGAIWGGDDMRVEHAAKVLYNEDVAKNVQGFGFVTEIGEISLTNWRETL